jgi:hypothetical protein
MVVVDLEDPKNRAFLTVEESPESQRLDFDLEILFYEPIFNKKFLLLTSDGVLHVFAYNGLSIEEEKPSEPLELKGDVTAVCFNKKNGFLCLNQFMKIGPKNYRNVVKVFRVNLEKWNWVEFIGEATSKLSQSMLNL